MQFQVTDFLLAQVLWPRAAWQSQNHLFYDYRSATILHMFDQHMPGVEVMDTFNFQLVS